MAEATEEISAPEPETLGPVVAKAGRYYRMARVLMTLLLLGYGAWSIYDGFVSWPNWPITHPEEEPKTRMDILLNKVLGVVLPPLGLGVLFWAFYNSRGEYRLENGILHAPGHPAVPLEKIHSVDRELWDRKGIAYVVYDLTEAPTQARGKAGAPVAYRGVSKAARGTLKLDDFVYDRAPVDQIFKAIEASLLKSATAKPPVQPPPAVKTPPRPRMGSKM
jgi:hypothetical protein